MTNTGASGTAHTTDKHASGGVIAGKDGYGAKGGVDGGKTVTSKGGMQAGVVAGLHANVVCNVGKPSGEPLRYPVTVTVSFGASVGVSGGAGKKEGSKASASVEVKASVDKTMVVTHMLTGAELGNYTKALAAASKGSKVAATEAEFAIITAGAKQGWDVARQMWETGAKIGKKTGDSLKHSGDSVEVGETKSKGAAVSANVGPVGGGYGVTETDENSKKVTRTDKGALDVEGKSSHAKETSLSGNVNIGVASVSVGTKHVHKTSFGYSIEIDPKNDPDGKILEALGKCKTELQYNIFLMTYVNKVTVIGRMKGKSDADSTEIGVSVGGVGASIGTHQGVDEQTKTDGKGELVEKTVVGHAGAGGKAGGWADSVDEDAEAKVDGDGNAEVTMTRTTSDNHSSRARDKKRLKKEEGQKTGALATAAGGGEEDDSTTHDVEGLTLTNADLKKIGGVACRSLPSWNGVPRRWQENEDWAKAGIAIKRAKGAPAVVAEQLARFIGGDRVERMKTVEKWVRGGYHATMGHAFEFPDSLSDLQADYNEAVADSLPEKMDILANKKGNAAAAEECKRLAATADKIEPRLRKCDEFKNEATKTEMLSRLTRRRQLLAEAIKGYGGLGDKASEDPKVLEEKCERLMKLCNSYYAEQLKISHELHESDTITVSEKNDVRKLIKKLEDLQHRWWGDWLLMKETFVKRKVPMPDLPMFRPDESIVAYYEKRIGD